MEQPTPPRKKRGSVPKPASLGPIERGKVYTRDEFLKRTKWSHYALRTAKRNGLKVTIIGGIGFVDGDSFCDLVKRLSEGK